jgi:hypothetical protein
MLTWWKTRPGAYEIRSVNIALLFARKAARIQKSSEVLKTL